MNAQGHEVIHGVVRGCYIVEDSRNYHSYQPCPQAIETSYVPLASFSASATVSNPKCVVLS
jgi:hypothetical protein